MPPPLIAEQAYAHELADAFRLVFKAVPERQRAGRVENALKLVRNNELHTDGVWVVRQGGHLLGAMVCMPVPGASALLWPPQALSPAAEEIQDLLLRTAVSWLRKRGAKMGQTLLAPHETVLAKPLLRNGFRHITRLWYLKHDLGFPAELLKAEAKLTFLDYAQCDQEMFQETLLASYQATRDCPEVNGVRNLQDILEGHKAQGRYDPHHWWLALKEQKAAGVLMLAELPEWEEGWDLSYLGVPPWARRQGVGRELTRKAILEAQTAQATQLTLSVDDRNRPAWNLYTSLGFEAFDEREVYLAIW
jgi:mycothiol synthase